MKWAYWICLYIRTHCVARGLRPLTLAAYQAALEQFSEWIRVSRADRAPDRVTARDVLEYLQHLREARGNGDCAVNRTLVILRSFYRPIVAMGHLEPSANPLAGFPSIKAVPRKLPVSLAPEQVSRLLAEPKSNTVIGLRDRALLALLYGTGIRASECATLRCGQVDLVRLTITVRGKGGHERSVPLNPQLAEVLRLYAHARGAALPTAPFFRSRFGRPLSRGAVYERVRTWGQRSRVGIPLSPHRLRHTFATHLVRAGHDLPPHAVRCASGRRRQLGARGRISANSLELGKSQCSRVASPPMLALARDTDAYPRPHAANDDSFFGGPRTRTKYTYDANGNMTTRAGAAIEWSSYNYPIEINSSGLSSVFSYGPARQRYQQVATFAGPSTLTTWYVGGILEKVVATSTTHFKHFIYGPKGLVASYNRRSNGTTETLYYTHDHLGSVDSVTTSAGAVSARLSYDLWGKRRNEAGWTGAVPGADWTAIGNSVRKGFTEHEHLDNIGLIHMNGRVYDPIIGRFVSADPFIPNPMSTQSFNRYSYVENAPLSFTDPSGFDRYRRDRGDDRGGFSGEGPPLWTRGPPPIMVGPATRLPPPTDQGGGNRPPRPNPLPPNPTVPEGEHPDASTTSRDGSILSPNQVPQPCISGATAGIAGGDTCSMPSGRVQVIGLCPDGSGDLCDLTELESDSSDINFAELGRAVGQRWDHYWTEEFGGDVTVALSVTGAAGGVRIVATTVTRAQWRNIVRGAVLTSARILKEPGSRPPVPPRPTIPAPPPVTQPYIPPGSIPPRITPR